MSLVNGDIFDDADDDDTVEWATAEDEFDDDGNPINGTIVPATPADVRRWTLRLLNPPWVDDVIDQILQRSDGDPH